MTTIFHCPMFLLHLYCSSTEKNSHIDPLGRPTSTASSDHYSHSPSVLNQCSKCRKTQQTSRENNEHYWRYCGSG